MQDLGRQDPRLDYQLLKNIENHCKKQWIVPRWPSLLSASIQLLYCKLQPKSSV